MNLKRNNEYSSSVFSGDYEKYGDRVALKGEAAEKAAEPRSKKASKRQTTKLGVRWKR